MRLSECKSAALGGAAEYCEFGHQRFRVLGSRAPSSLCLGLDYRKMPLFIIGDLQLHPILDLPGPGLSGEGKC